MFVYEHLEVKQMDRKIIGTRLKMIRKKQGIKKSQLAKMVNCDYTHIQKLEKGINNISLCFLHNILFVLNKDFRDLFNDDYDVLVEEYEDEPV